MSIFNFGKRQRLHAQLYGNTTGREMFKVDEYNQRKKTTGVLIAFILIYLTILYFNYSYMLNKVGLFFFLFFVIAGVYLFFNYKQQRRLREGLY